MKFVKYLFLSLFCLSCNPRQQELTKQDIIGSAALDAFIAPYIEDGDHLPTKEEFTDALIQSCLDILRSECGYDSISAMKVINDSIKTIEWDYSESMRENFYNTRTPQSLFVALNYLSKNENIKFTIADSTLTVSDDRIICPNGKIASLTYSLKREEWKDIPVERD